MYYKKTNLSLFFLLFLLLLSSCSGVKQISYFQKLETADTKLQKQRSELYEARIKTKDLLSITVVTSEPNASRMFNLITPQLAELTSQNYITTQPTLQNYLVNIDGYIDFPVFGKIKVKGLTLKELESLLQTKLESAFSKERPIVTIRFTNYAINVLGEVNRPGKYNTTNERMTIIEAIAVAGDLTIFGRRDNVKVLRENADGTKSFINVNLTDENIINSPAYYLEQNDVVYVEPNKTKARATNFGAAESFGISALSIVISMTSLLVNILR